MTKAMKWDYLTSYGVASEDELQLVTDVSGYSHEVLDSVLYARTGYRDFDTWVEDECYI